MIRYSRLIGYLSRIFGGGECDDHSGKPVADPFDLPEIRRMSLRELADLPFPRPGLNRSAAPGELARQGG